MSCEGHSREKCLQPRVEQESLKAQGAEKKMDATVENELG